MRKILTLALAAGALTLASSAVLAADAAAGKAKAAVCASCHGANGISAVPMYPNLAGQKEQYIVKALKDYKGGGRTDPTMKAMAAPLTDADIENVAAYFSSLGCK